MRALEITLLMIGVLTAPSVLIAMHVYPASNTCDETTCQAQQFLYSMANQTTLQQVNLNGNPASIGWDLFTFSLTFIVFAVFWLLYFLSIIVLVGPAMTSMFHVPSFIANWLMVMVWVMWMLAIVQVKRGGISVDGYR
jgi:hypothetical protein